MTTKTDKVRKKLADAYGSTARTGDDAGEALPSPEETIRLHSTLVRRLARRYARSSGGVLDVDDLISVGVMGLLQARENYDPAGGRPFRTYAEFRVRGAILDELRRIDPMSQPQRRKVRAFERALTELGAELGRDPTEAELAKHLNLSLEALQKRRGDLQQVRFVSTENQEIQDIRTVLSTMRMDRSTLRLVLVDAIKQLSERQQQVLGLYYFQDMKLREIGEILEVTEARVCQIHKAAVGELKIVLERSEGRA